MYFLLRHVFHTTTFLPYLPLCSLFCHFCCCVHFWTYLNKTYRAFIFYCSCYSIFFCKVGWTSFKSFICIFKAVTKIFKMRNWKKCLSFWQYIAINTVIFFILIIPYVQCCPIHLVPKWAATLIISSGYLIRVGPLPEYSRRHCRKICSFEFKHTGRLVKPVAHNIHMFQF